MIYDEPISCIDCVRADGRTGYFPFARWCRTGDADEPKVSAEWARRTPPEARGCGMDATQYEARKP